MRFPLEQVGNVEQVGRQADILEQKIALPFKAVGPTLKSLGQSHRRPAALHSHLHHPTMPRPSRPIRPVPAQCPALCFQCLSGVPALQLQGSTQSLVWDGQRHHTCGVFPVFPVENLWLGARPSAQSGSLGSNFSAQTPQS